MKFRPAAVLTALAVSGGSAAALFGGSAVSTAFTSQSNHNINFVGANVNGSVSGGDFSIGGLTPGGPAIADAISFNNLGNTAEEAYVKLGSLVTTHYGYNGDQALNPAAGDLNVSFIYPGSTCPQGMSATTNLVVYDATQTTDSVLTAPGGSVLCTANLGTTVPSGTWLDVATISAGGSVGSTVYFSLASSTGNSWNGASVRLPYTVQFQDTSGVNDQAAPTPGNVHNLNGAQQVDSNGYVSPSNG